MLAGAWAARAAQRPSIYACNSAIGACARAGRLGRCYPLVWHHGEATDYASSKHMQKPPLHCNSTQSFCRLWCVKP